MNDATKKMMIRMAMDYVIRGLEKLVTLLRSMDEDEVADKVSDLKGQLVEAITNKA
jgi:hypothetical protein